MKTKTLQFAMTTFLSAVLLGFAGCRTAPANPLAAQSSPTLAGGLPSIETFTEKATVTSVVPAQHALALQSKAGSTINCKVAPQVVNLSQLQIGEPVKVTVTDAVAIFLAKNGPPPSAAAGVTVAGAAEAALPGSVVLQTKDARAKVFQVDPSYRLLKLDYGDGNMKEFKIPLPNTLKDVQKGDEALVRATEPLAIQVEVR